MPRRGPLTPNQAARITNKSGDHALPTGSLAFPAMLRMANSRDFKRVLRAGQKRYHKIALVFSLANDLAYPRLGIIVARRRVPRAVDRNRIKRIVRESFRLNRRCLANADYIVMILEAANAVDRHQLATRMRVVWQEHASTHE